jgi:hypothetical protein
LLIWGENSSKTKEIHPEIFGAKINYADSVIFKQKRIISFLWLVCQITLAGEFGKMSVSYRILAPENIFLEFWLKVGWKIKFLIFKSLYVF